MATISEEFQKTILKKVGKPTQEEGSSCEFTLEEIDSFGDDESLAEMQADILSYNRMLDEKITFINEDLTNLIPFTRENLYLIAAYSGNGKSTCAANICLPLIEEKKKILIISNEESRHDIMFRIACLKLGYNFNDYKKGNMSVFFQKECTDMFKDIAVYVKIIDVNHRDGASTKYESVVNILEKVKSADYSAVLIDYFQLIQKSIEDQRKTRYDVLNDLRLYLQRYIKKSNIPVVLFAQLHSLGKRNNVELDSRVKECPSIIEASTVILEMIPNFEERATYFLIKKDRFGLQGEKVTCGFNNGRFVKYDDEFKKKVEIYNINKALKNQVVENDDE